MEEKDFAIINGYKFAMVAIDELHFETDKGITKEKFIRFFKEKVCIIHYKVPKDIDLNHYFEIMNSRGEQLEKHEIVKARLISTFQTGTTDKEKTKARVNRQKFNYIWEACSMMNTYVQQKWKNESIFGKDHSNFIINNFEEITLEDKEIKDNAASIKSC